MALIPLEPNAEQIAMFSALGFCIVMAVLMLLSLLTSLIGQGFVATDKIKDGAKNNKTQEASPAKADANVSDEHKMVISAAVASVMSDSDSAELLAVISAAAAVALDEEEVRVVSFRPVELNYSRYGREQIFSSQNYVPVKNR